VAIRAPWLCRIEGAYCLDDAVEEGDQGDDEQGGEGDVAEVGRLGVVMVLDGGGCGT
jgi:hypothetical protein